MPDIVRASEVTKSYRLGSRRVGALRGVNLRIAESGFYAIMNYFMRCTM